MNGLGWISLLLASLQISTSSISSKKASYDGNVLVLNGNVSVDHSLGKLESHSARLVKGSKEGPFYQIALRDDVVITLNNKGKIFCTSADFDFEEMKGNLVSAPGKMIHFSHLHPDLVSLSTQQALIEFVKGSSDFKVSKIIADGAIHAQYGYDFFLYADSGFYANALFPYMSASPNCKLTHRGDLISANKVEFFPDQAKIILSTPQGEIKPSSFSEDEGIQFSCNKMIWEKAPQLLTLLGNVSIHDRDIGDIHCEDKVEILQEQREGKWTLKSVTANGKTELSYELNAPFKHLLVCYGKMHLDQKKLQLTLDKMDEEPIEYFHDQMELVADRGQLDYLQGEQKVYPQSLALFGNIRLSVKENPQRCAIADAFYYYPAEEKIVLSSQDGNNVLFWDQEQELSVSAREVHISRLEKRNVIKGVGNVRLTFSSAENTLLKTVFPFYHSKRGAP